MALAPDHAAPGGHGSDRPVLGAAQSACAALAGARPEQLWALSDAELEASLTTLGQVHGGVEAQLAAVVREARSRGLGVGEGWGPQDWVRRQAPGLGARLVSDLDAVAEIGSDPRLAEVQEAVEAGARPDATDALPVAKAAMIARFHRGVRAMAEPQHLEDTTAELLRGARGQDGLPEKTLAIAIRRTADLLRPDRLVEHEAEVRRAHRALDKAKGPLGMWRYTMLLDDEGAAIVDAAVDALAKPQKDPDTGDYDPRTPTARRADALIDLVRRAASAPDGVPRQAKTSLVVTITLDQLQQRSRGAGLTIGGEPLPVETVRRLACDAQVIPAVLGTEGEILDQGRAERLFNRAQIRHLWLRDKHCTFPGCTRPASWCDAHHLLHWADGGPTDPRHGALLCQRHHTVVHSHRYAGEVVEGSSGPFVKWDLTPGSYDAQLAQWQSTRPAAAGAVDGTPGVADTAEPPPPHP